MKNEVPSFLLMDDQSYFELKQDVYGSIELALEMELEEYNGMKVFQQRLGYNFIDVA